MTNLLAGESRSMRRAQKRVIPSSTRILVILLLSMLMVLLLRSFTRSCLAINDLPLLFDPVVSTPKLVFNLDIEMAPISTVPLPCPKTIAYVTKYTCMPATARSRDG